MPEQPEGSISQDALEESSETESDIETEKLSPAPAISVTPSPAAASSVSAHPTAEETVYHDKNNSHKDSLPRLLYWQGDAGASERLYLDVKLKGELQILSLRVNRREAEWHWMGNRIVIEACPESGNNYVEVAGFTEYSWTEPGNHDILSVDTDNSS